MHQFKTGLLVLAALAATPTQAATPNVRLYTLDCGRIDVADMDAFADDGSYSGQRRQLVVPCYLIRHSGGDLLWDAGIGDQFFGPDGVTLLPGFVAHVPVKLENQLTLLGVSFRSIRYLAFSHEHVDHIGNANAFQSATWLLNRKEHAWTVDHDGSNGAPPPLLSSAGKAHTHMIDGDFDVFGDGSVKIIQAPGHTPGHQVLLVRPKGSQPILLAGDLWHSRSNFEHDRVPRFNYSRSETHESFKKIRDIAKALNARIVISHAVEDFQPISTADTPYAYRKPHPH